MLNNLGLVYPFIIAPDSNALPTQGCQWLETLLIFVISVSYAQAFQWHGGTNTNPSQTCSIHGDYTHLEFFEGFPIEGVGSCTSWMLPFAKAPHVFVGDMTAGWRWLADITGIKDWREVRLSHSIILGRNMVRELSLQQGGDRNPPLCETFEKTKGANCEIRSGAGHLLNRCIKKSVNVVDLGYPEVFFRINQMMIWWYQCLEHGTFCLSSDMGKRWTGPQGFLSIFPTKKRSSFSRTQKQSSKSPVANSAVNFSAAKKFLHPQLGREFVSPIFHLPNNEIQA